MLQLLWQKLWWSQIKREGRKKEWTNLFPLPDLGCYLPWMHLPFWSSCPPWDLYRSLSGTPPGYLLQSWAVLLVTCVQFRNLLQIPSLLYQMGGWQKISSSLQWGWAVRCHTVQKKGERPGRNFRSQGHGLPWGKGKTAMYRDAKSLQHPVGDLVNWLFIILGTVSYKQKGTNVKMLVQTCSFPKKAHSHFSVSGSTNTSSFIACQFLLKSLPSGSQVLRKYLGGLEACRLLS